MKKLVLFLTVVMVMAFSSICMAADGGDLNKEQKVADAFIAALTSDNVNYNKVSINFSDGLKAKLDEKTFTRLKSDVKSKMGNLNQERFFSFERIQPDGQQDKLTYIASFTNEKMVAMVFVFDKDTKLIDFGLMTMKPQTNAEAQTTQQAQ
ncbi:MAG: DUF3887 domain-containing protein [Firmicutes bacterium]|nr:DUF3887 domain-containing protein [Candidatus Alectryobacillus merdavium]